VRDAPALARCPYYNVRLQAQHSTTRSRRAAFVRAWISSCHISLDRRSHSHAGRRRVLAAHRTRAGARLSSLAEAIVNSLCVRVNQITKRRVRGGVRFDISS
jgi:hypothetical protein